MDPWRAYNAELRVGVGFLRCKHCALAVVRWSKKISLLHRTPSWGRRTAKI